MNQWEAAEQTALFRWADFMSGQFPEIEMLYHIPNGGSRNKIEAAHLKQQGVKAGVPDLCLPVARGEYHGLYIELKYGKNKPTENQKRWINHLRSQNYKAEVAYGWEEASKIILEYLKSTRVEK
ncbi:MAG: VRR-NUC domain-containing protein [Oscillospiraceae bacterium]|nr:VRR-NUC domain-containing protein [Oscillospiraceae bacterium]